MAAPISDGLKLPINSNRPDQGNPYRESTERREAPGHGDAAVPQSADDRVSLSGVTPKAASSAPAAGAMTPDQAAAMAERVSRMLAIGPTMALQTHSANLPDNMASVLR